MTPTNEFRLNVFGVVTTAIVAIGAGYYFANQSVPVNKNTSATQVRMVAVNDMESTDFISNIQRDLTSLNTKRTNEYLKQAKNTNLNAFDVMFSQPALVDEPNSKVARSDAKKSLIKYNVSVVSGGLDKYSVDEFTAVVSNSKNDYLVTGKYDKANTGLQKYRDLKVITLPDVNRANQKVEGGK